MGATPHDQNMVSTREYNVQSPDPILALPETIRLWMVREARKTFGMRTAGQLWFKLGLPVVPAMRVSPAQPDLFP